MINVIPDDIRPMAYKHIRTYDASSYTEYLLRVFSDRLLSICNKDFIEETLMTKFKYDKINIITFVNMLKEKYAK